MDILESILTFFNFLLSLWQLYIFILLLWFIGSFIHWLIVTPKRRVKEEQRRKEEEQRRKEVVAKKNQEWEQFCDFIENKYKQKLYEKLPIEESLKREIRGYRYELDRIIYNSKYFMGDEEDSWRDYEFANNFIGEYLKWLEENNLNDELRIIKVKFGFYINPPLITRETILENYYNPN